MHFLFTLIIKKQEWLIQYITKNYFVVLASPQWILKPTDIVTTLSGNVVSMCIASGSPEPEIRWYKKIGNVCILFT